MWTWLRRSNLRTSLAAAALAMAVAAVVVGFHAANRGPSVRAWLASAAAAGVDTGTSLHGVPAPDVTLTDQFGHTESLRAFRGRVVVLSFIDSRCTTICPITAQVQRDAQDLLGPAARRVQLLAVNANPQATSVGDVLSWSREHGMTHRWLFLTGPAPRLEQVWRDYHIYVAIVNGQIDHTPATYLIGPHGHERYLITTTQSFSETAVQARALAARVASLLPGRVTLATDLRAAAAPPPPPTGGAFTLQAIAPSGGTTRVSVGGPSGGGQAHLVAFFATWCPACREDLANLKTYEARVRSTPGLPGVVAVDLRVAEPSTRTVRQFVARRHLDFPVALDATGRVADAYGVTDLPYLALVSGSGRILWRHDGVISAGSLARRVSAALGASRPA